MNRSIKAAISVFMSVAVVFTSLYFGSFEVYSDGVETQVVNTASAEGSLNMGGINVDWGKTLTYRGSGRYSLDLSIGATYKIKKKNLNSVLAADGCFTVEQDGYYLLELWGGRGADGQASSQSDGGQGGQAGYVYGYIHLEEGQTLYSTIGGNGTSTKKSGDGGGANGDGGDHGDTGSFEVGGGGGYSALFLFDKGEFAASYSQGEDAGCEKILEEHRTSKYVMIAAGGGGGGAGNQMFFPATGTPDGGGGGRIGSLREVLSGGGYDVEGTVFVGGDGKSSGKSTKYIGLGASSVPGVSPETFVGVFEGKEPNDWLGTNNTGYRGGYGGDGNLRGGGGGAGFCGASGGIMSSVLLGTNIGGGGGGSSFISTKIVFEGMPGWASAKLEGVNPSTTGGAFILTFLGESVDEEPDLSHLGNAVLEFEISDYFDVVSAVVADLEGNSNGSADVLGGKVEISGGSIVPATESDSYGLAATIVLRAKDDFAGGNNVPIFADGFEIGLKTYDGEGGVVGNVAIPAAADTDFGNLPMKFTMEGRSHVSTEDDKTYLLEELFVDRYASVRGDLSGDAMFGFITSISNIGVYDESGSSAVTAPVTPGVTTKYQLRMDVTPKTDEHAKVGPMQKATTYVGSASIVIMPQGTAINGDVRFEWLKELAESAGIYSLTLNLKDIVKSGLLSSDDVPMGRYNRLDDGASIFYTAPNTGTYLMQVWGANGGAGGRAYVGATGLGCTAEGPGGAGGAGGYSWAYVDLSAGDEVEFLLGANGSAGSDDVGQSGAGKAAMGGGGAGGGATTAKINGDTALVGAGGGGGGGGAAAKSTGLGAFCKSDSGKAGSSAVSTISQSPGDADGGSGGAGSVGHAESKSTSSSIANGGAGGSAGKNYRLAGLADGFGSNDHTQITYSAGAAKGGGAYITCAYLDPVFGENATEFFKLEIEALFSKYFDVDEVLVLIDDADADSFDATIVGNTDGTTSVTVKNIVKADLSDVPVPVYAAGKSTVDFAALGAPGLEGQKPAGETGQIEGNPARPESPEGEKPDGESGNCPCQGGGNGEDAEQAEEADESEDRPELADGGDKMPGEGGQDGPSGDGEGDDGDDDDDRDDRDEADAQPPGEDAGTPPNDEATKTAEAAFEMVEITFAEAIMAFCDGSETKQAQTEHNLTDDTINGETNGTDAHAAPAQEEGKFADDGDSDDDGDDVDCGETVPIDAEQSEAAGENDEAGEPANGGGSEAGFGAAGGSGSSGGGFGGGSFTTTIAGAKRMFSSSVVTAHKPDEIDDSQDGDNAAAGDEGAKEPDGEDFGGANDGEQPEAPDDENLPDDSGGPAGEAEDAGDGQEEDGGKGDLERESDGGCEDEGPVDGEAAGDSDAKGNGPAGERPEGGDLPVPEELIPGEKHTLADTKKALSGAVIDRILTIDDAKIVFKLKRKDGFIGGNDVPVLAAGAGIAAGMKVVNNTADFEIGQIDETDFANVEIEFDFSGAVTANDKTITYGDSVSYDALFEINASLPGGGEAWKADFAKLVDDLAGGFVSPEVTTTYLLNLAAAPKADAQKAVVAAGAQEAAMQFAATVFVRFSVTPNLTNAVLEGNLFVEHGAKYKAKIVPESGYLTPQSVTVAVGAKILDTDEFWFDGETGEIEISAAAIDNNITITAAGGRQEFTLHFVYEQDGAQKDEQFKFYAGDAVDIAVSWAEGHAAAANSPPVPGHTFSWEWETEGGGALALMPSGDWWVFGSYRPNLHTLSINYLDGAGNALGAAYDKTLWYGYEYTVVSPNISGWVAQTPVVSGTIVGDTVVDVVYLPCVNTLTIFYIYADTNTEIAPIRYSQVHATGAAYSVSSPYIAGYTPDMATVSGTMTADGITQYVHYHPNKYTVTFDADGGSCDVASKTVAFNEIYGYDADLDEYNGLPRPIKTGYSFNGWYDGDGALVDEQDIFSHTGDITLTARWTKNKFKLVINYKYKNGDSAAEQYTDDLEIGDAYSIASPAVAGHTPDLDPVAGTMAASARVVTVIYNPIDYTLTIYYRYDNDTTAAPTYQKTDLHYQESYSVDSPIIDGYLPSIKTVEGTVGEGDIAVLVIYVTEAEFISVDVEWGDLKFLYLSGTWNPQTLRYEGGGIVKENNGSDEIKITSHSGMALTASLDYEAFAGHENVNVSFKNAGSAVTFVPLATGLTTPDEKTVNVVPQAGYYDAKTDMIYSGRITITINKND